MTVVKQALVQLGSKNVRLVRLLGSVLVLVGLLLLVSSLVNVWNVWGAIKNMAACTPQEASACAEVLFRMTGVSVWAGQIGLTFSQMVAAFVEPLIRFLFAILVLILGWLVYSVSNLALYDGWPKRK